MENKRIIILGPVTTKDYFGGVANFDEELNAAFRRIGYDSVIVTVQKNLIHQKENQVKQCSSLFDVYKFVKSYSPRMVIAALQYGAFFYVLPKDIKKIYVLHGFFDRVYYSHLKSILAPFYQKLVTLKSDRVVSNSYFTRMINGDFFNIQADAIIHLGVAPEYIEKAAKETDFTKEKHSILFAGRLVKSKRPLMVLKALNVLKKKNMDYVLYLAGDGEEKENLLQYAREHEINMQYLGSLSHDELYDYYKKSEVFVSLNDSEPMGIVFFEAVLLHCKVVSPFTGGQVESLYDLPVNTRCFVDVDSPESIAEGIEKMFLSSGENLGPGRLDLSYEHVAEKFLEL